MNVQPIPPATALPVVTASPPSDPQSAALSRADGVNTALSRATPAGSPTPVEQQQPGDTSPRVVGKEQVNEAVNEVQKFVDTVTQNLVFSVDEDSGRTVVKVVDRQTDEVLRQIPSEEMLDIAKALGKLKGLLVQQTA